MIRHTVTFKLKHESGSTEEILFLETAKELSKLPTVKNFECLKEIGKKNNFDFGISMEFQNMKDYEEYSNHPDHTDFVQNIWIPDVIDFIEIDLEF